MMPEPLANCLSLAGKWELRQHLEQAWREIDVPAAWETAGVPKQDPGPVWFRKKFLVPSAFQAKRLWLRFSAVSYHCQVWVNGQHAAEHRGLWDAFELEITHLVHAGELAELLVRVEKPASLTAGPDSPSVAGDFPLRQTLSGFLPYVCGHIFGGIWQDVTLRATGQAAITSLYACGSPGGQACLRLQVDTSGVPPSRPVTLSFFDPHNEMIWQGELGLAEGEAEWSGKLPAAQPWCIEHPALYSAQASLWDADGKLSDQRRVRFGLKSFTAQGSQLLLNQQPVYPRLVLSWGWYPDRFDPNPGVERVRQDFLRLQAMGYNGVKLCLWFPPEYYFDLADELGMLLWVELPLWLPEDSPFFRQQTTQEYQRLVCLARQHPSVVLYTLGCELAKQLDQAYLLELYQQVQGLLIPPQGIPSQALLCDNSDSAEAYGGWLDQRTQFYDHHFYAEPHFLNSLLSHFRPGWRQSLPWLMGEFCDYDTLRQMPALLAAHGGQPPWWGSADPKVNPQGARWEMRLPGHAAQLRANGLWDDLQALVLASNRQALLHRKITLELVRSTPELSGYVVTGERDTPVSTAGMWDDLGRLKFDPQEWRCSNQDTVLCLGFDRRRSWIAGGDRPASPDHFHWRAGDGVRLHLLVSHYGSYHGPARLRWQVDLSDQLLVSAESECELIPGSLRSVGLVSFRLPAVTHPQHAVLSAHVEMPGESMLSPMPLIHNHWSFWIYPPDPWVGIAPFGLLDAAGLLPDLPRLTPGLARPGLKDGKVIVCSAWTPEVQSFVQCGGRVLLLQQAGGLPGPLPVLPMPFWRESLKLALPHPAWGDFPFQEPGLQFYGLAPDCALQASGLADETHWRPILRRLDTRSMRLHEYLLEMSFGNGQMIVTTLRLQGGLGDQPSSLSHNLAGQWLLASWLRYLQGDICEMA